MNQNQSTTEAVTLWGLPVSVAFKRPCEHALVYADGRCWCCEESRAQVLRDIAVRVGLYGYTHSRNELLDVPMKRIAEGTHTYVRHHAMPSWNSCADTHPPDAP